MDTRSTASLTDDERQLSLDWGEFQLLERIGRGSCADAWLALRMGSAGFAKLVVLKVLRDGVVPEQAQDTLEREALALSRMNHPNVVQVLDVVEQHQRRALVMEYIEGKPLTQIGWPPMPPLTLPVGLRLLHDVLLGLDHVHNARDHDGSPLCIVHGDVSPNNVLLTYTGQAKLIDFGLAQHRGAADTAGGTLRYMAPERLLGDSLTPAADIYGLGVMMWELLAQRPLWEGLDRAHIQAASLAGLVQAPLSFSPSTLTMSAQGEDALGPWLPLLERACMKALAYFPKDRHASSADFARELSAAPLASHGETQAFLEHFHGADREARRQQIANRIAQHRASEGGNDPPAPSSRSPVVASAAIRARPTAVRLRSYSAIAALGLLSLGAYAVSTLSSANAPSGASHPSLAAPMPSRAPNDALQLAGPFFSDFAAPTLDNNQAQITPPRLVSSDTALLPFAASEPANSAASNSAASDSAAPHRIAPQAQGLVTGSAPQSSSLRARRSLSRAQARPRDDTSDLQTPQPARAAKPDDCSSRFVYENGIKRFKAACFR